MAGISCNHDCSLALRKSGGASTFYSLSLWERAGVRVLRLSRAKRSCRPTSMPSNSTPLSHPPLLPHFF